MPVIAVNCNIRTCSSQVVRSDASSLHLPQTRLTAVSLITGFGDSAKGCQKLTFPLTRP